MHHKPLWMVSVVIPVPHVFPLLTAIPLQGLASRASGCHLYIHIPHIHHEEAEAEESGFA